MGEIVFADRAAAAGVDGVLVVDYPPEEAGEFAAMLTKNGIAPIFLLSPTTPETRIAAVGKLARGYVYYVSLKGVTGAGHLDTEAVALAVPRIKQHVKVPVGVGFGIRDAASAKAVAQVSDAVVIGSALVQCLEVLPRDQVAEGARRFIAEIRAAVDETRKA
jgi:tryptophan synthase alpha chain